MWHQLFLQWFLGHSSSYSGNNRSHHLKTNHLQGNSSSYSGNNRSHHLKTNHLQGNSSSYSGNNRSHHLKTNHLQGNSTGVLKWAVPGTFTRLRSCIVPAEITEPPPKLAVVKTTSTIGLWNIFHKKLMITSIAEFSHSNRTTAFSHDQVDRIFPVLKITLP